MNEEIICPKCGKGKLFVIDRGSHFEYDCEACDYSYREDKKPKETQESKTKQRRQTKRQPMKLNLDVIKILNKFSGIITIVFIVLLIILFSVVDSQVASNQKKIGYIQDDMVSKVSDSDFDKKIVQVGENITSIKSSITAIITRIGTAETKINQLFLLEDDLEDIQEQLTNISKNLGFLWHALTGKTEHIKSNIIFTYYANQTGTTRYCHLNFGVKNNEESMDEIKFGIQYAKVNITLLNWTGNIKPQQYQWINGNYSDNYFLHWFGANDNCVAKFNMTWDISDYNTSKISKLGLKRTLTVNSFLIDIPEIWEEEIL